MAILQQYKYILYIYIYISHRVVSNTFAHDVFTDRIVDVTRRGIGDVHLSGAPGWEESTFRGVHGGRRVLLSIVGRLRVRGPLVFSAVDPSVPFLRPLLLYKRRDQPHTVVIDQRGISDQVI